MHIIKITPVSFKIILSKEDLQRHGVENILEDERYTGEFFAEIIDRTNALYGSPFEEGSVDAEFFASRDGGGELFISRSQKRNSHFTYLFKTKSLDNLISLCRQLPVYHSHKNSTLYYEEDIYCLLITFDTKNDFVFSRIKEYGHFKVSGEFERWSLEEHGKVLIKENAIEQLCLYFGTT